MQNEIAVALVKLLGKQVEDLKPGLVRIDTTVTLHVTAEVKRGEDVEYTPTTSIPLKTTLAILLDRMGFQRDKAIELLVGCMTAAIVAEKSASAVMEEKCRDIDTAMDRVNKQICQAIGTATRKGATTVKGTVKVVNDLPNAA